MITFEYRGFDSLGRVRNGLIEAADLKQAREKLVEGGVLPELVAPAGRTRRFRGRRFRRGLSMESRSSFYRELLSLLRAGLPLVRALDILIQSPETGHARSVFALARDRIKEGASLADALADAGASVNAFEKAAISAGERAGVLDAALENLAVFLEEQSRLRDSVVTALIYPALVVTLAVAIAVGLLGFAVPRIGGLILEETSAPLPLLTRAMIGIGEFLAMFGPLLLAVVAAGVFLGRRRIRRDPSLTIAADRLLFLIPALGRAYTLLVNLRFARTLSLLLGGDITLIEGMKLAGAATGSPWVNHMLEKEAESVRHGCTLAEALRRVPPLSESLARWTQVGESGGQLPELLESAGQRFMQQWERFISRFTALLEPALIVAVSAFVLLVVLSVLLPIMSLNTALL